MPEPKPIVLTQIDSVDYSGPAPKPYVVVGDIPGGGGGGDTGGVVTYPDAAALDTAEPGEIGWISIPQDTPGDVPGWGLFLVVTQLAIGEDTWTINQHTLLGGMGPHGLMHRQKMSADGIEYNPYGEWEWITP